MSDQTFDGAMESHFVICIEENSYAAGPKKVQEYRGGALKLISLMGHLTNIKVFC